VATVQGLKMHGGMDLKKGFANLDKHLKNLAGFGQTVVVALNRYSSDLPEEIETVAAHCERKKVRFAVNNAYEEGGKGARELAETVVDAIKRNPSGPLKFTYDDEDPITEKIEKIAKNIYGAKTVFYYQGLKDRIARMQSLDLSRYPVCIAKTQYSFSTDPKAYGVAKDFEMNIQDILINNGAGMIIAIAGDIVRMPGLPKNPQASNIDIIDGVVSGLS